MSKSRGSQQAGLREHPVRIKDRTEGQERKLLPTGVTHPLSLTLVVPPEIYAVIDEVEVCSRVPCPQALDRVIPVVPTPVAIQRKVRDVQRVGGQQARVA